MNAMTHDDAVKELGVERYLLDELQGEARDRFEAHLFDCTLCAADLKSGLLFVEAARQEMLHEAPASASTASDTPATSLRLWLGRLFQPLVLGPAFAAALAVIVYQSAFLLPRVETQLAQAQTPSIVDTLTLANAGPRGDGVPAEIVSSRTGVYQLSVDLPPAPGASALRLTLYDPSGKAVWHTDLPNAQEKDSVKILVPVAATGPGTNLLVVQSVQQNAGLTNLASYKYNLRLRP